MNTKAATPFKFKHALMASVGSGLEYYDFVIFLFLSKWISLAFFPNDHSSVAIIKTLGIFLLGAIARPVGAYFMGRYADRTGRRVSYMTILVIMTLSTLGVAITPSYHAIGMLAPILLILLRLAQSVGFGSDLPCSIVLIAEHASPKKRGYYCGLLVMNIGLGSALGTAVSYLLTHYLSNTQMYTYGWRLAFAFGVILNFLAFYFRKQITETPLFRNLAQLIKTKATARIDIKACLRAAAILLLPSALVMLSTTFPLELPRHYAITSKQIYFYLTVFTLIESALIPVFGWLGDIVGRRKLYISSISLWLVIMPYAFVYWLAQPTHMHLILFFSCYDLLLGLLAGCFFLLIAENFSTANRCSQYGLSYNIVYLIMSALPLFNAFLAMHHIWLEGVVVSLVTLACISLMASCSFAFTPGEIKQRWSSL